MLKRNIEQELATYEVEETGAYNGLIILIIIGSISKCTLDELACSFYLVRFTKVLSKLLNEAEREQFLEQIPEWELGNLDSVLSPYIIQKYDVRFMRGIKELLAKNLVQIEGEFVSLSFKVTVPFDKDFFKHIQHKAVYASLIINSFEISQLLNKIYQIVGEEQWENLYLSTESR